MGRNALSFSSWPKNKAWRTRVHFRGRQSRAQVADAMRRATVFALPSRYEGLGCVYLEAMAAGKPVIACRGQGIEEVIEPGMNGCLIATDDLQGLADTLTAASTLKLNFGEKWVRRRDRPSCEGIRWQQQAARLFRLYRECQA